MKFGLHQRSRMHVIGLKGTTNANTRFQAGLCQASTQVTGFLLPLNRSWNSAPLKWHWPRRHPLPYARHLHEQATQSYSAIVCLKDLMVKGLEHTKERMHHRAQHEEGHQSMLTQPWIFHQRIWQHREQNRYQWNRLPTNASWYPATALLQQWKLSTRLQKWLSFSWILPTQQSDHRSNTLRRIVVCCIWPDMSTNMPS